MRIGGLRKTSLIDYPGKVSCVIFTQGCNFRCLYCHNRDLVIPQYFGELIPEQEFFNFLKKRSNQLQGVVVSGGEPTLQPDLKDFLRKIKAAGYCVKLDTNGSHPLVLKDIISAGLVDFVAMDIKAPLARYPEITGVKVDTDLIRESIDIIVNSKIDHLFRTTIIKPFFSHEDFEEISSLTNNACRFILQNFVPCETTIDETLSAISNDYSAEEFSGLQQEWQKV